MRWLMSLLFGHCFAYGCETVKERQPFQGIDGVLGFRCQRCGEWEPAVRRTRQDMKRMGM